MGIIMKAMCESCGFEKELYTGGGKRDCSIDTILAALPEAEQQTLSKAVKLGAKCISINREPCSCAACKEIYTVPVVTYTIDGKGCSICGACPKCKKKGYEMPVFCPDCGAKLSVSQTGLWD